tara:strand:- start:1709 stop:1873 length:165 start_codon:yes stop_codon:yes gene_type:complete
MDLILRSQVLSAVQAHGRGEIKLRGGINGVRVIVSIDSALTPLILDFNYLTKNN